MQILGNKFAGFALATACGIAFIGTFSAQAKPAAQPSAVKRAVPAPVSRTPAASSSSIQATPREAQAMLDYASSFNAAVQNIGPASDAVSRMHSQATQDTLSLPASERTALANSWVASVTARTKIIRNAFGLMGETPTLTNRDLQQQVIGFSKARTGVLAVLDRFDDSAQRLSSLVIGWTPERNDEVVAALAAERIQSQGETLRAFAATNTAIAATMVPQAPSRNINVSMAAMYTALATNVDRNAGKINAQQAAELVGQQAAHMRIQSPEGRQKVQALQARLRDGLKAPGMSVATKSRAQAAIVAIGDYNRAFDLNDRISNSLDQIQQIILKDDADSATKIDRIITDIAALELELQDVIRNITRRLAG